MIVDSSAVLAIILDEPEGDTFAAKLREAEERLISAANYLEIGIVLARRGFVEPVRTLERLLQLSQINVVSISPNLANAALGAFLQFGRGRHPARLNFGDCFAYALAKETGQPLLFKGGDFARTDITPAVQA